MSALSGLDAWLTREPSVFIDPHAPYVAWRTDGMYEPEVPAQVILGDPEGEGPYWDLPNFETAEIIAAIFNSWYPRREHTFDPADPHGFCRICGEPSPAAIEIMEREELEGYPHS